MYETWARAKRTNQLINACALSLAGRKRQVVNVAAEETGKGAYLPLLMNVVDSLVCAARFQLHMHVHALDSSFVSWALLSRASRASRDDKKVLTRTAKNSRGGLVFGCFFFFFGYKTCARGYEACASSVPRLLTQSKVGSKFLGPLSDSLKLEKRYNKSGNDSFFKRIFDPDLKKKKHAW